MVESLGQAHLDIEASDDHLQLMFQLQLKR